MFLDGAARGPRGQVDAGVRALFELEPCHVRRARRRVVAVVTTRDAGEEARVLAPALRACRRVGHALEVYVLPVGEESSVHDAQATVCRTLDVERAEPIPAPQPAVTPGLAQMEMRHAYRVHEFLKTRPPDILITTQGLGTAYFALGARTLGVGYARTRFVLVLAPFELQSRLNARVVTSEVYALIRFQLERAVVESADVCVAPSQRFVDNALRTGAAAPSSRFVVLPELEAVGARSETPPGRPHGFLILDVAPLARNIAFFATVAKRRPEALRDAEGHIRLHVDAHDRGGALAALCAEQLAGTEVAWSIGRRDAPADGGERVLFVPFCEDFFALGASLAPAVRGAPVLVGTGAAVAEPFEAAGVAVEPFPDVVAEALADAAQGRRGLRITARPADRETPWCRLLENLAPPQPFEAAGTPRVSVCILHFNRPGLVGQALSSVLEQTYERLEIVLFDDGSNAPGAVAALEALVAAHDGRVRLVRQDNRYTGAAHNAAARAARGEYVYFLDDDNLLKPEAIETLVRAACASGKEIVGSFSDIFTGECRPAPGAVAGQRILQAGGDGGFSLYRNAILDGNMLCRRESFLELGGHSEEYGVGKEDQEFFARAVESGRGVGIVPEALCWARRGMGGIKSLHYDWNAGHFRVLEAYWPAVDARYRALLLLLQGLLITRPELTRRIEALRGEVAQRDRQIEALRGEVAQRDRQIEALRGEVARRDRQIEALVEGHVMALARRRASRLGPERLEVGIVLHPEWVARTRALHGAEVTLELCRNGRVVACLRVGEASQHRLRVEERRRLPAVGGALYSLHERCSGEVLAMHAAPGWWRARRVVGAVESRPTAEVRGWVLDGGSVERVRRVAIHVQGSLRAVLDAGGRREDIARWKGTGGRHGFEWSVPEELAGREGVCIEVFDAETGRPLRGSPLRIEGGRAVASAGRGR